MLNINSRLLFLLSFVFTAGLLVFALYLQYYQGLEPCALCMLQRITFIAIGLVALVATIHNPNIFGMRSYGIINTVFSLIGTALATRHVWIENLPPDQVPECGPGLQSMLEYLPLFEALKNAVMGSGDCAAIDWSLFGLSIASWSLICFIGLLFINLSIAMRPVGRF